MSTIQPTTSAYLLNNEWPDERQRLGALQLLYDPVSARTLEATGVRAGWRWRPPRR